MHRPFNAYKRTRNRLKNSLKKMLNWKTLKESPEEDVLVKNNFLIRLLPECWVLYTYDVECNLKEEYQALYSSRQLEEIRALTGDLQSFYRKEFRSLKQLINLKKDFYE